MKTKQETAQREERVGCAISELLAFLDEPLPDWATGKVAFIRAICWAANIAEEHGISERELAIEAAKSLLAYRKSGGTEDDFTKIDVDRRMRRARKTEKRLAGV